MAATQAWATALALLSGFLTYSFCETQKHQKDNGNRCNHHRECLSDCCLMDLERRGAFCASKAKTSMACLPQTKGALNIMCPCRAGLSCLSRDSMCPRRCQMF